MRAHEFIAQICSFADLPMGLQNAQIFGNRVAGAGIERHMDKQATVSRQQIVQQLVAFLTQPQAHITLEGALKDLPANARASVAEGMPYSVWQLVEHLRIAQQDILLFSRNSDGKDGKYAAPDWPADYWVSERGPASEDAWQASLAAIAADTKAFCALLSDDKSDLTGKFPWGDGQNLLREALLIGDHSAYHVGEIVAVRRALGCWKK